MQPNGGVLLPNGQAIAPAGAQTISIGNRLVGMACSPDSKTSCGGGGADGHRTVGFAISPYTRHGVVDRHFYTIVNMYRTIEQILGLPLRNQFDVAAKPMGHDYGRAITRQHRSPAPLSRLAGV